MARSITQAKHYYQERSASSVSPALSPSLLSFEAFKQQLEALNQEQLRSLRNEINRKLDDGHTTLLTEDETKMISSLFS